LAIQRC